MPVTRVLVANRGEIALRVLRACQQMGIETVLATSEADRDSLPAREADRSICIGPALSSQSYLNVNLIVQAAIGCTPAMDFYPNRQNSRKPARTQD